MTDMHRYPPRTAAMHIAQNARRDARPFLDELLDLESHGPDEQAREAATLELHAISELVSHLERRLGAASLLLQRNERRVPAWDSHRYRELAEALTVDVADHVRACSSDGAWFEMHVDSIGDAVKEFNRKIG